MERVNVRTGAATDGRFDRIVVQRFANATQRCGRINHPPPQRLANRTLAHSTRAPVVWRARGARGRAISEPLRRRT
eukprot:10353327-Lingulodinium_polyedra.AAC.1